MTDIVVLVTGASGLLGREVVVRLAAAGHRVVGLDPAAPGATAAVQHVNDDLSDRPRLRALLADEKVTHIVHAGGVSGPMVLADEPVRLMAINVTGSLNLLNAALETGVRTFVYCSSVSAVGEFYEDYPIGDDYPLRPRTTYGCSKAAVDMVLRGLWRRVPLDLCSLQFTNIYGPERRTQFVIGDILSAARSGRPARVEAADRQSFIFVDDAADAAAAACLSGRRRQLAYFIGYPEQVTLDDIAAAVGEFVAPVRLEIDTANPPFARGPLDLMPAMRDFAFAPKIDLREGVRRLAAALGV